MAKSDFTSGFQGASWGAAAVFSALLGCFILWHWNKNISKMWESWFALANWTMFVSEDRAKYEHIMVTTQYQPIPRLRLHWQLRCKPGVNIQELFKVDIVIP